MPVLKGPFWLMETVEGYEWTCRDGRVIIVIGQARLCALDLMPVEIRPEVRCWRYFNGWSDQVSWQLEIGCDRDSQGNVSIVSQNLTTKIRQVDFQICTITKHLNLLQWPCKCLYSLESKISCLIYFFLLFSLRCSWHITLYQLEVYNIMIWYVYFLWND